MLTNDKCPWLSRLTSVHDVGGWQMSQNFAVSNCRRFPLLTNVRDFLCWQMSTISSVDKCLRFSQLINVHGFHGRQNVNKFRGWQINVYDFRGWQCPQFLRLTHVQDLCGLHMSKISRLRHVHNFNLRFHGWDLSTIYVCDFDSCTLTSDGCIASLGF